MGYGSEVSNAITVDDKFGCSENRKQARTEMAKSDHSIVSSLGKQLSSLNEQSFCSVELNVDWIMVGQVSSGCVQLVNIYDLTLPIKWLEKFTARACCDLLTKCLLYQNFKRSK